MIPSSVVEVFRCLEEGSGSIEKSFKMKFASPLFMVGVMAGKEL